MKFQSGLDVSTQHRAQSGRYSYKMKRLYYLRISTLPLSLGNESCVIRIVPQYFQTKRESYEFKDFKHFMKKKQGLLLFSGPTGSGKSTLMYQMVLYAHQNLNLNVISVEAILRCDPDVILIGEIRDSTVAKYVIQASLSGHLVLSTMHANDCKGALLRLLEMGISVQELCQAINLISNQRLITTTTNTRQLVSELMFQSQINYFFEHNHSLPKNFTKLSTHLNKMSKEGVICEEVVDKYI